MPKRKKGGVLAVVLVVLIALAAAGGLLGSRYMQIDRDSDVLLQELDVLQAAQDEYITGQADSRTALEEVLGRTVCATNPCQSIERGAKSYVGDLIACLDDYKELNEDARLAEIFLPENIAADGPEFEESIAYLESMRTKFANVHARFADLLTDDMLKSYMHLDDMDFVTRAVLDNMLDGTFSTENLQEWSALAQQDNAFMDECIAALELLADEPENWAVNGGYVEIYDDALYDAYASALDALTAGRETPAA